MHLTWLVVGIIFIYSSICVASDKNNFYALHDVTCKQYLRDRLTTSTSLPHVAWVSGYISAFNRLVPDNYDIANGKDAKNIMPFIDQWCQANTEKSLGAGMEKLTEDIWIFRRRSK